MPPIHREKSLDEYCINSNANNLMKNKRNQMWNPTNGKMVQLSAPSDNEDATRTKRVSEGSSNSNCSSSSDNFADGNNCLQSSPASKNTAYSSSTSSSVIKSDCLYSSSTTNSNFINSHSPDNVPLSDSVDNKNTNCMRIKTVLNDIKMELQDVHQEHHNNYYFQNDSKETPMQQNFTNNPFQVPTASNYQAENLPGQF